MVLPFSHSPKINTGSIYKGTRKKDFCREALAWRSLVHKFILPLVGIFEEKSQQFLVSPLMKNGTLTQWRKSKPLPPEADINRLVSFDASTNRAKSLICVRCLRLLKALNIFTQKGLYMETCVECVFCFFALLIHLICLPPNRRTCLSTQICIVKLQTLD